MIRLQVVNGQHYCLSVRPVGRRRRKFVSFCGVLGLAHVLLGSLSEPGHLKDLGVDVHLAMARELSKPRGLQASIWINGDL